MKKGFLILVGTHEAKNILQEQLKTDWWIWNINPYNHIRHNASAIGWEFDDTNSHDEFIGKLLELSNEYFDYEYKYVTKFISRVTESNKAKENSKEGDLLVVHGINRELIDRLNSEFSFYVLNCTMEKNQVENNFRDGKYEIGLGDSVDNIRNSINNIMKYVTHKEEN